MKNKNIIAYLVVSNTESEFSIKLKNVNDTKYEIKNFHFVIDAFMKLDVFNPNEKATYVLTIHPGDDYDISEVYSEKQLQAVLKGEL